MAKHRKPLPARKPRDRSRDDDDSLLLRSAEALGRAIGALQRQLDGATKRLALSTAVVGRIAPASQNGAKGESRKKTAAASARRSSTRPAGAHAGNGNSTRQRARVKPMAASARRGKSKAKASRQRS